MSEQQLRLTQIRTNGGTQMRAALDQETVTEYANAMRDNGITSFPPVIVYYDGTDYWLGDGFHRVEAVQRIYGALEPIPAEVRPGTRRDAILHAAGANANHGRRRTNADKRRAIETLLRDEEWTQWSDREIARICLVDHKTVGGLRRELSGEIPQIPTDRTVQRNGQTYTMHTTNITAANQTRQPAPSLTPAPEFTKTYQSAAVAAPAPRQLTATEIEAVIYRAIQHAGHTTPADQLAWLTKTTIDDYRPLLNPGVTLDHDPDLFHQLFGYIRGKLQRQILDRQRAETLTAPTPPTPPPTAIPLALSLVWAALNDTSFPRPILPAKIEFLKSAPFAVFKTYLAKGETVTDETMLAALGKAEAALTLQLNNCSHTLNNASRIGPDNRCDLCGHHETNSVTPAAEPTHSSHPSYPSHPPAPAPIEAPPAEAPPTVAPPRPHVTNNSGNNEWYTPAPIADAARTVMGVIDLDPASCVVANTVIKAEKIYTIADDGLTQPWTGRIWLNPPYASDLIGKFVEKLTYHLNSEDITEAIVLVNNATETAWFQDLAAYASAVCFPKGRLKYWNPDRPDALSPLQGQAILYIGPNNYKFRTVFSTFGVVL